jgi:hypothetical protein
MHLTAIHRPEVPTNRADVAYQCRHAFVSKRKSASEFTTGW